MSGCRVTRHLWKLGSRAPFVAGIDLFELDVRHGQRHQLIVILAHVVRAFPDRRPKMQIFLSSISLIYRTWSTQFREV